MALLELQRNISTGAFFRKIPVFAKTFHYKFSSSQATFFNEKSLQGGVRKRLLHICKTKSSESFQIFCKACYVMFASNQTKTRIFSSLGIPFKFFAKVNSFRFNPSSFFAISWKFAKKGLTLSHVDFMFVQKAHSTGTCKMYIVCTVKLVEIKIRSKGNLSSTYGINN